MDWPPIPRPVSASAFALALHFALAGCAELRIDHAGIDTTHAIATAEHGSSDQLLPEQALEGLKLGNDRFVQGEARHPHQDGNWRGKLENGQHPFATVVGCSDSRVPVELLFDQGFGDLFVIRVAGNMVIRDEAGSIEYSVLHLHTPLVAIIGHDSCGAVTAAMGSPQEISREPVELVELLAMIHIGLPDFPADWSKERRVAAGVEANVRHAMHQLAQVPAIQKEVSAGRTRIVGGVYNLHTGAVRWLE